MRKRLAKIRVAGPDRTGIIAAVTGYLAQANVNIEDIDQRILDGILVMTMLVDFQKVKALARFQKGLQEVAHRIKMQITFHPLIERKLKNIAILVTQEDHCLREILKQIRSKKIKGRPLMILGNRRDLFPVAKKYGVPFYYKSSEKKRDHEIFLLKKLQQHDVDLIVLARYMQILSPEFVFQHEGKIINIHPSLLPSFPGARPYEQAYDSGVEVIGVTSHFVTTDLDRGPIICQGAFKIDKSGDDVEVIRRKGRRLEARVLAKAVKLFTEDRLFLRRGKVLDSRKMKALCEKTHSFYS